uniref:Putative salivary kunitz domain protein n=1 Tax=Ixodes ricinus TaxID=34613 RepID=A0A0K8RMI7_IXORI
MLLKVALVIALATRGLSSCLGRRNKNVCLLEPQAGNFRGYVKAWYYDVNVGKCSPFVFGDALESPDENRFSSETECNELCRSEVPIYCFENITSNVRGRSSQKWTYRPSSGQCVRIHWHGAVESGKNVFNSHDECERKCRIPDFGPCAKGVSSWCKSMDTNWYRFDMKTLTCREMRWNECPNGEGNAFALFYQCNQRCGRFVRDKCRMPIQNMSICSTVTTRYGYNYVDQMCEEFQGCDDGGNSFPSAEMCWETCAKNTRSPCVMRPDFKYRGFFKRYYYDIKNNTCKSAWISGKGVPGNTNLFWSMDNCESACIAKHRSGWRY